MAQANKTNGTVLGLDIGIGSIGWAILDFDQQKVIDLGAHLFDPPQDNKTKVSLASKRRAARSQRRNIKRSADRNKHCLEVLKEAQLVPDDAGLDWLQMKKGDTQLLEARAAGLNRLLTDREFAQILFNISKRRGYIPHGERESDAEGKKVLKAIQNNAQTMEENGWRTVGEMMFAQGSSRNKAGNYEKCVTNAQLVAEVNQLFAAQQSLGNAKATAEFLETYLACMTWQKDTADDDARVYSQVASCEFFPDEKRAPKACLSFELCTAYERINHTVIVMPDGSEKKLPPSFKQSAIATLFSPTPLSKNKECKVRYSDIRKALDLPATATFKGIDPAAEKDKEISKPVAWRLMRNELPEDLMRRMHSNRDYANAIGLALTYSSSEATLREKLEEAGTANEDVESIVKLPYNGKVFSGYGKRSIKALDLLIDSFEDVTNITNLAEAMEASGLKGVQYSQGTRANKLPPYTTYDPTCNNPVVLRTMGRVRKVVNAIIDHYGMPDEIHIELARELKHSAHEKTVIHKSNVERERNRKANREQLAESLGCTPEAVPPKLIRKLELWKEQGGRDLYTDLPIPYERMIEDATYCDIDHILPYSRTCDDSSMNKVLVSAKSNRSKGNKTPYEWLSETGEWEDFKSRIQANRDIPYKKRAKLLEEHLDAKEEDFINRNLNDTRYATRAAYGYIADYLQFPDNGNKRHVYAVAGGATSALRGAWGFATKDRQADDLHHAVDAAIIAACSASTVIKVAKASESKQFVPKEERALLFANTVPWEGFAETVEELAKTCIPTKMVDHSGSARLFEDFYYRYEGIREDGKKALLTRAGTTKPYGNYVLTQDGSAQLPDGMAFLRMWWDEAKSRYLPEPVYYSDLASIRRGEYVPRIFTANRPRPLWSPVPETAVFTGIELRYGMAIRVNDRLVRYASFDSSGGSWRLRDIRRFESDNLSGTSIGSIKTPEALRVIHEDILGFCYKDSENNR